VLIDTQKHFYGFQYVSDLRYLAYNEFNAATRLGKPPLPSMRPIANTPYGFQARGTASWLAVAKTVRLPSPFKYLKKTKIV
jgi:hypothetical protein